MCLSAAFIILLIFKSEASGEEHGDHFNNAYAPSTVNFNEIFTNSLSLIEEPTLTSSTKDEDFHLHLPSQFVEFRPIKQETTTTPTPPPPMYLLNSSYLKKDNETDDESRNKTTTISPFATSDNPKANQSVSVIPINKKSYQRGVLDLLFPASRVRAFKGVFDTFRRILSHTFLAMDGTMGWQNDTVGMMAKCLPGAPAKVVGSVPTDFLKFTNSLKGAFN